MSDPLRFTWESTPALWRCNYDPEGPSGFGKTKEQALADLLGQSDNVHDDVMVAGAVVAAIEETQP